MRIYPEAGCKGNIVTLEKATLDSQLEVEWNCTGWSLVMSYQRAGLYSVCLLVRMVRIVLSLEFQRINNLHLLKVNNGWETSDVKCSAGFIVCRQIYI